MQAKVVNVVLLVGLFFSLIVIASGMSSWRLPDNQQGYAPEQPIVYSHRLHAGELGIDCQFCHSAAGQGRHAGIPSTDVCMKCHRLVTASAGVLSEQARLQDQLKKLTTNGDGIRAKRAELEDRLGRLEIPSKPLKALYETLGLNDPSTAVSAEEAAGNEDASSIEWARVHNLPDYVYFDHRAHVTAGVACQKCHGPVESMERMRQFETLSMGWCVNCHREATANGVGGKSVHASIDCAVCHY